MKPHIKKRLLRTLALSVFALLIGAGIGYYNVCCSDPDARIRAFMEPASGNSVPGSQVNGAFSLLNQDGQMVTNQSFPGKFKLIYFGFSSCPEVCPNSLQRMAKVMNELGDAGETVQPLFITIDPDNDTPEVLKKYVALFHPRLVGLTGTPDQTDEAIKNFKVYASTVNGPENAERTINHSDLLYLLGLNDELLGIYHSKDEPADVAKDIKAKL